MFVLKVLSDSACLVSNGNWFHCLAPSIATDKGQSMTLISGTCTSRCIQLVYYIYQLIYHRLQ